MSSEPGSAILMCTTGTLAGSKFELKAEALFIGCDAQKRILVTPNARQLSERYARISVKDGAFKLEAIDGGSGLTLDGGAVSGTVPLGRLHTVGVGKGQKVEFVFRRLNPTPAQPSPVQVAPSSPQVPSRVQVPVKPGVIVSSVPSPQAAAVSAGTMMDKGGFSELPVLGRTAKPTPGAPPIVAPQSSPPPSPQPIGTMVDLRGLSEIPDPRKRSRSATPATPAAPVGTVIDAGGLPAITDPRQRSRAAAPPTPAALPPQPPPPRPPATPATHPPAEDAGDAISGPTVAYITGEAEGVSPFELIVTLPGLGVQTYRLKYGDNVVGRSETCDIQIRDAEMVLSRRHAIIKISPEKIELVDLKGQNGTFVNGKRIETAILTVGSSFHLGPRKFGLLRR